MQSGFWKADWFLAVAVVLVFALFNSASDLLPSLENKAYDLGMQAANRAPSERIVVIAIDDTSIANIGRWPWPRDVHARMTDLLAAAKAKVIGNLLCNLLISARCENQGTAFLGLSFSKR